MRSVVRVEARSTVQTLRSYLCGVVFLFVLCAPAVALPDPHPLGAQELRDEAKEGIEGVRPSEKNLKIYKEPGRSYHRKGEDLVGNSGKECTGCHSKAWYPAKDFFGWEHWRKWQIHWILFSMAFFVMMTGIYGAVSIWRQAESPSLHHPVHWPSVIHALFWDVFLGRRIWRQNRLRWAIFFFISMSFIELFLVFLAMVLTRYIFPMTFFLTGTGGWVLDFLADFLGLLILVGIVLALYRRYFLKESHLESDAEDVSILWILLAIVGTGFFLEACRLAVVPLTPRVYASFAGACGAEALRSWGTGWTGVRFYVWLVHAILVCVLFAYLPFSKLFHVITCPASILATASEAAYRQQQ